MIRTAVLWKDGISTIADWHIKSVTTVDSDEVLAYRVGHMTYREASDWLKKTERIFERIIENERYIRRI